MQGPLAILFYAAFAGILVVLALGLVNLVRRDENQASRSNQLMRYRIFFQAIAVLAIVGIGWASGSLF